jgi:hypothetical protein
MRPVCENCGISVVWRPTIVDGHTYCCLGCTMGGPCTCDYSNLPRLGEFRAIVHATSSIVLGPPEESAGRRWASRNGPSPDPMDSHDNGVTISSS